MNTTIKVVTEFNSEIIQQHLECEGPNTLGLRANIAMDIIRLKEQGIEEALIKLGWTPPKSTTNNL